MKQTNIKFALEVIGQGLKCISEGTKVDEKDTAIVNNFLQLATEAYVVVQWPESQELMEEDWFEKEAILDVDGKFGSSAYFVPLKRLV